MAKGNIGSENQTVWEFKNNKFSNLTDQLLFNRLIKEQDRKCFFEADFNDLFDPYLISDMKKAVLRIKQAVDNEESIGIFADYDADGVPGAALLFKTFKLLGIKTHVFIPSRENGYGLCREGIDFLKKNGVGLIITVDLGIKNIDESKYCQEIGIDLIITDHHIPGDELPRAEAVINPKLGNYPCKDLSGCAVAYKLACALSKEFPKIDEKFLKWNLDLVGIATISDLVPLVSENRILAKYGIKVLQKSKNLGLNALYDVANINKKKIDSQTVGFQIGPRINAPGRIDHAVKSYQLLVSEDEVEAQDLAVFLDKKNRERQKQVEELEKAAITLIEKNEINKNKIIIVYGGWAKGIIGPSASRLVERFCRPAIVFSHDSKEGDFTGSARSLEGIDIFEILNQFSKYLKRFGGHKGAAGLTVLKEKFELFSKKIIDYCNERFDPKLLIKKIKVEYVFNINDLKFEVLDVLEQFEPFGMGNARPVFLLQNINFENAKFVGKEGNHFSARITNDSGMHKVVFFNCLDFKAVYDQNDSYDVVFTLDCDEWQGRKFLSLNIIDIKKYEK